MFKKYALCLLFFCSLQSVLNEDRIVQMEQDIRTLKAQRTEFLPALGSSIIKITATGIVFFLGCKWLISTAAPLPTATTSVKKDEIQKILTPAVQSPQKESFTTFKDLAGTIAQEILEIIDFIKNAAKYDAMGAKMPRGILLEGPPGTGKTSIARAIAGEAGAYFIATSASHFVDRFAGNGPRYVQELFAQARAAVNSKQYPLAIIFIDEIDSIGNARRAVQDSAGGEYRNTLNELLHQMDGFARDNTIFVLAATNREKDIDEALLRPGRFDRIVHIPLPDLMSREAIVRHYTRTIKHSKEIDFAQIAFKTEGMSGADLKNLVNEAAILAVRSQAPMTSQEHFDAAIAQVY